jgi:hypothetical protein
MNDNKEDLILITRFEPSNKHSDVQQGFFENLAGLLCDQYASIWQLSLLFENAQIYPASLPLPLTKIILKTGALVGQLLGYKVEYEEYTTIVDEFN